jgi:hypothetical protein
MKLLWILGSPTYARNFESAIRRLAESGHEIVLAPEVEGVQRAGEPTLPERLAAEHEGVTVARPPAFERDRWSAFRHGVAFALDSLRFYEPPYDAMPFLRGRAVSRTPPLYRALLAPAFTGGRRRRAVLRRALRAVERAVPLDAAATDHLRRMAPDAVLVTPYVDFGTPQARWVRAARALGVRSCISVYSWDALTVRGQIRELPDLVTVWNETQVDDAVDLHAVPRERVVATGAQAYDHWFEWAPDTSREEFCARVGLPAERPYVLYLASSGGYVKNEVAWVAEWIERLRATRPELRDVGVLVRPHPKTKEDWHVVERAEGARVWPPRRAHAGPPAQLSDYNVASTTAKREFYDSIYHAAAVVGVNTSALIESAIVGRPVHTYLDPRWRYAQEQTLHFRHMVEVAGGFLEATEDFDEHARQVARSVAAGGSTNGRAAGFLRAFIRPAGLEAPATPRYIEAIERLVRAPAPVPRGRTASQRALGLLLAPLAAALARAPASDETWTWAAKRARRRVRRLSRAARKRNRVVRKRLRRVGRALRLGGRS